MPCRCAVASCTPQLHCTVAFAWVQHGTSFRRVGHQAPIRAVQCWEKSKPGCFLSLLGRNERAIQRTAGSETGRSNPPGLGPGTEQTGRTERSLNEFSIQYQIHHHSLQKTVKVTSKDTSSTQSLGYRASTLAHMNDERHEQISSHLDKDVTMHLFLQKSPCPSSTPSVFH